MPQQYGEEDFAAIIPLGSAFSSIIYITNYQQGILFMPTAWTAASIGFYVLDTAGNGMPFFDGGVQVQINLPVVSQAYAMPLTLFASQRILLWSQTLAVSVLQTAERGFRLSFK